jgi:hypothetical protein
LLQTAVFRNQVEFNFGQPQAQDCAIRERRGLLLRRSRRDERLAIRQRPAKTLQIAGIRRHECAPGGFANREFWHGYWVRFLP